MAVWHGRYAVQMHWWLLAIPGRIKYLAALAREYPALPSPHRRNDPRHGADMLTGICPGCGLRADLDVFCVQADANKALAAALELPPALGSRILRYLRLFSPPQQNPGTGQKRPIAGGTGRYYQFRTSIPARHRLCRHAGSVGGGTGCGVATAAGIFAAYQPSLPVPDRLEYRRPCRCPSRTPRRRAIAPWPTVNRLSSRVSSVPCRRGFRPFRFCCGWDGFFFPNPRATPAQRQPRAGIVEENHPATRG